MFKPYDKQRPRLNDFERGIDSNPYGLGSAFSTHFLGQVIDGGEKPDEGDHFILVNPVRIRGTEAEGGAASLEIDTLRSIPVVVVGSVVPDVGELVTCFSLSNRWACQKFKPGSPPEPPGILCGRPCSVCDGVYLQKAGTIGGHPAYFFGSGPRPTPGGAYDPLTGCLQVTSFGQWWTDWLSFDGPQWLPNCGEQTKPTPYAIGFECYSTSQIRAMLLLPSSVVCGTTPRKWTWWTPNCFVLRSKLISASCAGGFMSATATWSEEEIFAGAPSGTVLPSPPPVSTVAYSIPIETAGDKSCCNPGPIPKEDLRIRWTNTISGDGSATLTYNAETTTWTTTCQSGIKYEFKCQGGIQTLIVRSYANADCTGAVVTSSNPGQIDYLDFDASPFESTFAPKAGSSLAVNGFTGWIVDNP